MWVILDLLLRHQCIISRYNTMPAFSNSSMHHASSHKSSVFPACPGRGLDALKRGTYFDVGNLFILL